MPYVEASRARLYYQDWGAGQSIVFVHGWAIGGSCWEYQALPLSERGFRCISYDQRGCGRSDDPGVGFDYDTLSDDLAALMESLDLRDVSLISHSMGGGVVTRYLARHGSGRVARILLAATTTPFPAKSSDNPGGIDAEVGETLIAQMCADRPRYVAGIAPGFFGAGLPDCHTSPEIMQWGINLTLQASPKASVEMFRTSFGTDQRAELSAIAVPALIIHGDMDQSSPIALTGKKTASLIPGSRFAVYEGAPHGLLLTHPDRFNCDLVDFIKA
ncbi:MAG: alpha/beta fold hydrolase [Janthinobacterium lividum]